MSQDLRPVSGCDYLNQAHPALRTPAARIFAVHTLLDVALRCARRFRIEFDGPRLARVLDKETFAMLLPTLPLDKDAGGGGALDACEAPLDPARAALLRRLLSFGWEGWSEPPINMIDRTILLDGRGQVVLRGNDNNDAILFALPEPEKAALLACYGERGIPAEVVERVAVNINQGV